MPRKTLVEAKTREPPSQELIVVPQKHIGRWSLAAAVILAISWLGYNVSTISVIDYGAIPRYLFNASILQGVLLTVELAVIAQVIGVIIGIVLSAAKLSGNPVLVWLVTAYVWVFRGSPLILQILFWYNGILLVFPRIALKVPFIDWTLFDIPTSSILTVFVASLLALSLNQGAYMAEIVRGGILAVDRGQMEASNALGLTGLKTFRYVLMPQVIRVIIPPTGNQFLSMIKDTSLISVIAGGELLTTVRDIYSTNSLIFELLAVACFWYLVLTSIAYAGQHAIERRLARGHLPATGGF